MTVLVTGAAGFIGSHLTEALLQRGEAVCGLDSFDDFYARSTKEANLRVARDHDCFQLVEGDIRDAECLANLPDGIDSVIHLAARAGVRPSIERPTLYVDVNVMGTARILDFVRARGLDTVVFASSSSVYGNNEKVPFAESDPVTRPISPYAATKRGGELLCSTTTHLDGATTACLRFFTAYGPRQRPDLAIHKFSRLMRAGEAIPVFGDGSTSRDYTYVGDVVSGVMSALDWARDENGRHEIINLGNSQTVSLSDLIDAIAEAVGTAPEIQRLPEQPGDVRQTHADPRKARELLGFEPVTDLKTGLRNFVDWLDETG